MAAMTPGERKVIVDTISAVDGGCYWCVGHALAQLVKGLPDEPWLQDAEAHPDISDAALRTARGDDDS